MAQDVANIKKDKRFTWKEAKRQKMQNKTARIVPIHVQPFFAPRPSLR